MVEIIFISILLFSSLFYVSLVKGYETSDFPIPTLIDLNKPKLGSQAIAVPSQQKEMKIIMSDSFQIANGINQLFNLNLSNTSLLDLNKKISSQIPYEYDISNPKDFFLSLNQSLELNLTQKEVDNTLIKFNQSIENASSFPIGSDYIPNIPNSSLPLIDQSNTPLVKGISAIAPTSRFNIQNDYSETLTGKTFVVLVFVSNSSNKWSSQDINDATNRVTEGMSWLESIAPPQANLNITVGYYVSNITTIPKDFDDGANMWDWSKEALSRLGFSDRDQDNNYRDDMMNFINNIFGSDNVITLFVLKSPGRSYAFSDSATVYYYMKNSCSNFFGFIFCAKERAETYTHEMLHLFNALDQYPSGCDISSCSTLYEWDYTNSNCYWCLGSSDSIMKFGDKFIMDNYTRGHIGWGNKDSDGFLDYTDLCPKVSGSILNEGCQPSSQCFNLTESVYIGRNVNLCPASYNTAFLLRENNIIIDCKDSKLVGNNTMEGTQLWDKFNITIKNCIFENFSTGVDIRQSDGNLIFNNSFIGIFYNAFDVFSSNSNFFIKNLVKSSGSGFNIWNSDSNNFQNNSVLNNSFDGITIGSSNNNLLVQNIFCFNKNSDINSGFPLSNIGYGNSCDKNYNWDDQASIGCTVKCSPITTTTTTTTTISSLLVNVRSPENETIFGNRKFPILLTTNQLVNVFRALNSNFFSRVCSNCSSYSTNMSAHEGENRLSLKFLDQKGNELLTRTIYFFIDSITPRIITYQPLNNSYVKGIAQFTIKYTENNVKSISLYYGAKGTLFEFPLSNCESGSVKTCSGKINVSQYDGSQIYYYFVVRDSFHSTYSKLRYVNVDNTNPIITVNSPLNQTYSSSSVRIDLQLSEEVDSLKMSTNGGSFSTLCSDCDSFNRTRFFSSRKTYNLLFQATDKAGNVGLASVIFTRS